MSGQSEGELGPWPSLTSTIGPLAAAKRFPLIVIRRADGRTILGDWEASGRATNDVVGMVGSAAGGC